MIVRRFLLWARTAVPGRRAEAVAALARAYLYSDLSATDRWEAETALTAMLDDPSPLVRRAMAESFANASDAPRQLVVGLANDQSDIAALVLSRSPVLTDPDLIDCAALGGDLVQTAIAMRPHVPVAVAGALAEIAVAPALVALAGNPGADIAESSLRRMVERHGSDARLREALMGRADLPLAIRQAIAVALSHSLAAFVSGAGWLSRERCERVAREAREKTTVAMTGSAAVGELAEVMKHLRGTGQLTPALMLRAILSRNLAFAEAAFAELSGMPTARIAALLRDRRGSGFPALYRRAALPASLEPAFAAALSALREAASGEAPADARLSRRMIERTLTACSDLPSDQAHALFALLRRYEVEAARDEARELAETLGDEAALAAVSGYGREALLGPRAAPVLLDAA